MGPRFAIGFVLPNLGLFFQFGFVLADWLCSGEDKATWKNKANNCTHWLWFVLRTHLRSFPRKRESRATNGTRGPWSPLSRGRANAGFVLSLWVRSAAIPVSPRIAQDDGGGRAFEILVEPELRRRPQDIGPAAVLVDDKPGRLAIRVTNHDALRPNAFVGRAHRGARRVALMQRGQEVVQPFPVLRR